MCTMPHLWWFTLVVVYSAKKRHLCTGNLSLSRDEWMACSLNTAGRVDRSDMGHLATWEWNSSGKRLCSDQGNVQWTHQPTIYCVRSQTEASVSINKIFYASVRVWPGYKRTLCLAHTKNECYNSANDKHALNKATVCRYLCHDVMWPDVRGGGDVLSLGALWLGGPEQSGAKHGGQVMEGHLVDGLLLSHPAGTNTDRPVSQGGRG